jgi:ABC-type branched-subunit amino acid transport system substrate-binding protein
MNLCLKFMVVLRWLLPALLMTLLLAGLPLPGVAVAATPATPADAVPDDPDPLLAGLDEAEIMRLGEQMYRHGILPSGEVMLGYVHGDIEVDGGAFSCASCHQRAGLGSYEGGVETPPTNGLKLYQPYRRPPSLHDVDFQGRYIYAKTILDRPAYSREALKRALRVGVDPAGEDFNEVMPRYPLEDRDMAILVRYLELLSREFSPGASPTGFSFATIITDDVSPEERQALLRPLEGFIYAQNQQVAMYRKFIKTGYKPTDDMKYSFHSAVLKIWDLKGPPETWQSQLDSYLDRDRVFAVLGGISNQDWRPIHEFCEARRLPCLFPITNLPVVSEDDWYTMYFNKGYYQEGATASHFLSRQADDARILQLVQDSPAGRHLAAGFDAGRRDLNLPAVESVTLAADQLKNPQFLADLLRQKQPEVLLLWVDSSLFSPLQEQLGATVKQQIFVSSTLLGQELIKLPDSLRPQVFITWPYRLKPYVGDEEGTGFLSRNPVETTWQALGARRIASLTATMLEKMLTRGMLDLENNLYRDHLLDEMSMQMDRVVFDFERLSSGPGQRYASKGCYILQLGPGPEPKLLPRSDWVIH